MKNTMGGKFVEMAIRAAIIGVIAGGLYAAFGWIAVAVLSLIELGEISNKLDKLVERQ